MKAAMAIAVSDEQRAMLEAMVRSQTIDVRAARRARIVLLAGEGMPYAAIVPDPAQRAPEAPTPMPTKSPINFQVGDMVGFTDKYLHDHIGTIKRVNDKTVSIDCDGARWRVSPRLLRKIIDL